MDSGGVKMFGSYEWCLLNFVCVLSVLSESGGDAVSCLMLKISVCQDVKISGESLSILLGKFVNS